MSTLQYLLAAPEACSDQYPVFREHLNRTTRESQEHLSNRRRLASRREGAILLQWETLLFGWP
jgi:hypothetical protein